MSRVTCPGLRVLLTCFGDNLTTEWLSIAATIRSGQLHNIVNNPISIHSMKYEREKSVFYCLRCS